MGYIINNIAVVLEGVKRMDSKDKISSILLATDFSPEAERAYRFAKNILVPHNNARFYIITVIKPVYAPMGDLTGATEVLLDENSDIIKEMRERVKKLVDEVKKAGITNCEGIIKYGDPVSSILEVAEKLMPDMIVMGNRKPGFKKGILFGSVSQRVSANSPVSVLIVR